MNLRKIDKFQMDDLIRMALKEDIISEDISTNAIYKNDRMAEISLSPIQKPYRGEGVPMSQNRLRTTC